MPLDCRCAGCGQLRSQRDPTKWCSFCFHFSYDERYTMIKVSKSFVVDGVDIYIQAEGGSAKEALAIVEAAGEELGAAPPDDTAKGAKRPRRTKAEMDAAKAAAAANGAPAQPVLP